MQVIEKNKRHQKEISSINCIYFINIHISRFVLLSFSTVKIGHSFFFYLIPIQSNVLCCEFYSLSVFSEILH